MNHQSMPLLTAWFLALAKANSMASKTGRRWRVRQAGTVWYCHEVDQATVTRKTEPTPEAPVPTPRESKS